MTYDDGRDDIREFGSVDRIQLTVRDSQSPLQSYLQ